MRVLLDECVPEVLRHEFADHSCETVRYAGLGGLKNGQLLNAAERAGFDVMVTVDQSIPYQQNMIERQISLVVIRCDSNSFDDVLPSIPAVLAALHTILPGEIVVIK